MQAIQQEQEALDEMLEQAMDEMLGNEPPEGAPEGEPPEGEPPEGEPPEGEPPEDAAPGEGEPPEDETLSQGGQGEGETQEDTRTEKFYDPVSGETTYGKVYAAYYARYLEQLEEGNMPQELEEINNRYFDGLNP